MVEYTPNNTNSKVHTVELMLLSSEGADMNRKSIYDTRITGASTSGRRDGADVSYLRFNPNVLKVFSKQTSRYISMGDCESLADFRLHVADWAQKEQIPVEAVAFSRVDYAIDYDAQEGADRFRQMCDMLILAFNVKHNVSDKNQYYGGTQTTMKHKNNKTKWGPFEIECYRKCIQKQESNVQWRLELRYMQDKRLKKRCIYRDILPMLEMLRSELRTLPDYFGEAQSVMNATLADKFRENVAGSGKTTKLNNFIFLNRDRVFSRKQLQGLYSELGDKSEKQVKDAVHNYCNHHKAHRLISKDEFVTFVKTLDAGIEMWVKNDPKLGDFFTDRMRERENKYNQLPF